MYYPYLRGRQFELIAIREFASVPGVKFVTPIIEPVKESFNSLRLAAPILREHNLRFALILNPAVGHFKNDFNPIASIMNALKNYGISQYLNWIPAFNLSDNYHQVFQSIYELKFNEVMIICSESTDTSNPAFAQLIGLESVRYLVSKENRSLRRRFGEGKNLIRLDDNFVAQKRNSDYLNIPEEKFSEEHLYYSEEGYHGFSDFTLLESEFNEGGAAPYAVAIHLSYKKDNNEIWVRHFTSDTNDDRANIQGKFAEAAAKAVRFLDEKNIQNEATDELRSYYNDNKYPGLGMIKKISIKNHLELVNSILINEYSE